MNFEIDPSSNRCQCPFNSLFILNNDATIHVCQNRKKSNRHLLCEEHYTKWQKILTQILTHALATNPTDCLHKMKQFLCRKLSFVYDFEFHNWNCVQNFVYAAYFYSVTQIFIMLVLCDWSGQSNFDELENIGAFGTRLIQEQLNQMFEKCSDDNSTQQIISSNALDMVFEKFIDVQTINNIDFEVEDENVDYEYLTFMKYFVVYQFIDSMFEHIFSDHSDINSLTWTERLRETQSEFPQFSNDMFQYKSKDFYHVFFGFLNQTNEMFSDVLTVHNDGMSNFDEHDKFVTLINALEKKHQLFLVVYNYLHLQYSTIDISTHTNIVDLDLDTSICSSTTNLLVTQFNHTTCIKVLTHELYQMIFNPQNKFVKLYDKQFHQTICLLSLPHHQIEVFIDVVSVLNISRYNTLILMKNEFTSYLNTPTYSLVPVSQEVAEDPTKIAQFGLHVLHLCSVIDNPRDLNQCSDMVKAYVNELCQKFNFMQPIIRTIQLNRQSRLFDLSQHIYKHTNMLQDICYAYNVVECSSYWNKEQMNKHQFSSPYSLVATENSINNFHDANFHTNHTTLLVIGNPQSRFQICTITAISNISNDKSFVELDLWINFRPMHLIGYQPNDKQQKPDYESNGVGSINYLIKQIMKFDHNKDGLHTGYLDILTNHELNAYQQQNTSMMKLLDSPKKTMQKHIEDFVFEILQVQKAKQTNSKSQTFKKNVLLMQQDDRFKIKNIIFNGVSLGSGCAIASSVLFCKSSHEKIDAQIRPSIGLFQFFGGKDAMPQVHEFIKKKFVFSIQANIKNDPFNQVPCEKSLVHSACDELVFDVGSAESQRSVEEICQNLMESDEFKNNHINAVDKCLNQLDNFIWSSPSGIFLQLKQENRKYDLKSKRLILTRAGAKRIREEQD